MSGTLLPAAAALGMLLAVAPHALATSSTVHAGGRVTGLCGEAFAADIEGLEGATHRWDLAYAFQDATPHRTCPHTLTDVRTFDGRAEAWDPAHGGCPFDDGVGTTVCLGPMAGAFGTVEVQACFGGDDCVSGTLAFARPMAPPS